MQFNTSIIETLQKDFPEFTFIEDSLCLWSPRDKTIHYEPIESPDSIFRLLHEVSHGLLEHSHFIFDADLVRKEVDAWEYAEKTLGRKYSISIPKDFVEEALDSYRIWIHNRSLCPICAQNGMQTQNGTYECLNCRCRWRANDARQCQLKRYKITER